MHFTHENKVTLNCNKINVYDAADKQVINLAPSWENLFMLYANNKGADQTAHPHSLISAFVVRCLDSIIIITCYNQNFKPLASLCSWAGWFEFYLVRNPEDRFSRDVAQLI